MNPDFPIDPRPELEARLSALLLGELPAEEAAALRQTLAQDPELAALHERLKLTIELVRETAVTPAEETVAQSAPLRLNDQRREELLQQFKTVRPKEFARPRRSLTLLEVAAVVAIMGVLAALLLPTQSASKTRSMAASNTRYWGSGAKLSQDTLESLAPAVNSAPSAEEMAAEKGGYAALGRAAAPPPSAGDAFTIRPAGTVTGAVTAAGAYGAGRQRQFQAADIHTVIPGFNFNQTVGTGAVNSLANVDAPSTLLSAETLRRIESRRLEAKAELGRQETLLSQLSKLNPAELPQVLPSAVNDSHLSSLLEQKTLVDQKLAAAEKQSRPSDAELKALQSQRDNLNEQLGERAKGDLLALSANVDSTRKQVADLEQEADRATSNDIAKAAESRPYFEAKRLLEEKKRLAQVLDTKIAMERTNLLMPKSTMVEIPERAVPTQSSSGWEKLTAALGGDVERKAKVRLEQDQTDISGMQQAQSPVTYDPYFVQTELEALRSEEVLGKVIAKLKLNEAWAKKPGEKLAPAETLKMLRKKLHLSPVENTSLLDIGVKSDTPAEAANLANAIADAYRDYRQEKRQQLVEGDIAALKAAWAEQNQKVREAQAEVDRLQAVQALAQKSPTNAAAQTPREPEPDTTKTNRPKPSAQAPIPQPEILTCDNAFSTFSLNVSDVSFKLAAASLEKGALPDAASIRSEEFINAFDYRDPEAPAGVPVAFAWERAGYPFAQSRDLLRFSLKTAAAGRQAGRPLNIVLLLDNSGSMERADRVRILREALRVLAAQLQPQDKFSLIAFARTAQLRVDGVPGNEAAKAAENVANLTPQGGTNLEEAMNLAYQTALRHYLPTGINRVVLLTDGAANLGEVEPESLKQEVESHRKQGIAFDCFGIGWEGYNDDLLEVLSRNGDGRYGFINTPEEASAQFAAQLAGALRVAAADVKVQVEFNPNRVTAYRQIGYARHQLTQEQFRDNTVDAAELGAAEAGNALYAVEVNPHGAGPLATVRIRYKVPGTADYREQEWPVPYTGNAVALDQASPAMRLAASASAFAEWLAASPYAAEVAPDRLLGYLGGVPEVYGADPRPRKLEWMLRQAKSIAGK